MKLGAWAFAVGTAALAALLPVARARVLHGLSDEALLVPLARWTYGAELYPGDAWLRLAREVFSHAYSGLLGAVLGAFDDPVVAGRVLAFPFLVVFLAGSYRVAERVADAAAAACVLGALAILPHLAAGLGGDPATPLAPGASLPRDLVFALLPWLWLRRETAGPRGRALLYLGAGLLANLHPLTAMHLVAVLLATDALTLPRGRRGEVVVGALLAAAGAAPYVVQWLGIPRTAGAVAPDVLAWRIEGIGTTTPSVWTARLETALWIAAAAWVVAPPPRDPALRSLRVATLAALVLAMLHPAFHALLAGSQFDRLARVVVWLGVVGLGVGVRSTTVPRGVAAAVGLAVAAAGPAVTELATGARRGPLEWVVRRAEVRLGLAGDERPPRPERPRPGPPWTDASHAAAFREVCAWARAETPKDALFAVPPEDWGAFRAYACRAAVVTRKEGGFALSFLGGRGNDWFAQYREAVEVYASRDPARWTAWRDLARFTHAVLDDAADGAAATPVPPGWTQVHASGPFRVLAAPLR